MLINRPQDLELNGINYSITGIDPENCEIEFTNKASFPRRCSIAILQKKVVTYKGKKYSILDAVLDKHPVHNSHIILKDHDSEQELKVSGTEIGQISFSLGSNRYVIVDISIRGCFIKGCAPEYIRKEKTYALEAISFQAYVRDDSIGSHTLRNENLSCKDGKIMDVAGRVIDLSSLSPTYIKITDELSQADYVIDAAEYMEMCSKIVSPYRCTSLDTPHKAILTNGSEVVDVVLGQLREIPREIIILEYTIGDPEKIHQNRVMTRLIEIARENPDCKITLVTSETASLHKQAFKDIARELNKLGINVVVSGIENKSLYSDTPLYLTRSYGILNHAKAWVVVDKNGQYSGGITTACVAHSNENKTEATVFLNGESAEALAIYSRKIGENQLSPAQPDKREINEILLKNGIVTTSLQLSDNSYARTAYAVIHGSRKELFLFLKEISYGPVLNAVIEVSKQGVNTTLALRTERSNGLIRTIEERAPEINIILTTHKHPRHHANIIISDRKIGLVASAYPAQYCIYQWANLARCEDLGILIDNGDALQKQCELYLQNESGCNKR